MNDRNAPFNYGYAEVVSVSAKSIGIRRGKDKTTWIPKKAVHESCKLMTTQPDGTPLMTGSLIVAMWFATQLGWPAARHLPILSPAERERRGLPVKKPPKEKKPKAVDADVLAIPGVPTAPTRASSSSPASSPASGASASGKPSARRASARQEPLSFAPSPPPSAPPTTPPSDG